VDQCYLENLENLSHLEDLVFLEHPEHPEHLEPHYLHPPNLEQVELKKMMWKKEHLQRFLL
jgi:hypothetical protein